jgi:DNA-binding GntR family transcriptional regulator
MERSGRTGPKYRHIADDLRDRIAAGEFDEAGRLPAKDQLHQHYGAAINTIERAIDELRREGRVETVHGSGTFVRTPPAADSVAALRRDMDALQIDVMELYAKLAYEQPSHQHDSDGKARHERTG